MGPAPVPPWRAKRVAAPLAAGQPPDVGAVYELEVRISERQWTSALALRTLRAGRISSADSSTAGHLLCHAGAALELLKGFSWGLRAQAEYSPTGCGVMSG